MSLPQIAGLELQDLIGRGSCGAVYRAVALDSKVPCAVKVFSSMAINRKLLGIASRGLQTMPEHPGLLRPIAFDFDSSPYFQAVPLVGFMTEDGKGKKTWESPTLETCCGKVPPDEAWRYIYEVCDAMAWLHKHNLVHCNLKPRNVLLEDDQASATKICDPVQGWIGGIHHFEATDHFMYLSPEQAERPDGLATHGTQWDVYSFGVVAFRLLTGKFPRAEEVFNEQLQAQRAARGAVPAMDGHAIMHAVRHHPEVTWPAKPASKWDERRRQIIDKCLALDPKVRWPDLREVMRDFEKLEADFLLEDAREKIEIEKRRQARKVVLLRMSAVILGGAFIAAMTYWWATLHRAKKAESTIGTITEQSAHEVSTREDTISRLSVQVAEAREAKRLADANLQMSQEAVDNFLTQLLALPTGLGLHAEISEKQINDALLFYEKERERINNNADLLPELARNTFNTAQLLMRKQKRDEARHYFELAQQTLTTLLQKEPQHVDLPRRQALLGRTCRWLGTLKADDGHRSEAFIYFQEAVKSLTPALEKDSENRGTRFETAMAWYEFGKRARRDGRTSEAVDALNHVPLLMDQKWFEGQRSVPEQFLVSRSQIEQALTLRDEGKLDDAMKALFDSMELMVKLVERAAPNNQEQALTLAEAYIEFGEIVAGKLGTNDAKEAQAEAQAILMELVRQHPQWADARYLLARSYGDIAVLERDLGNSSEAIRKQTMAVQTLDDLSKENPANTRFLSELARQQGQQAQLFCDLSRAKDAIPLAQAASDRLQTLLTGSAASKLDELDRKTCGVLLAQLYGILGRSGEMTKNASLAKTSFTKASAQWEELKAKHGTDQTITEGLTWTQDRLKKMK